MMLLNNRMSFITDGAEMFLTYVHRSLLVLEKYFKNYDSDIHRTSHINSSVTSSSSWNPSAVTPESLRFTPTWEPSSQTPTQDSVWDLSSRTPVSCTDVHESDSADSCQLLVVNPPKNCSEDRQAQIDGCLKTPTFRHILLNELLTKVKLNVIVNGGGCVQKEVAASVAVVDGHLEICHIKYGRTNILQPEWVTPKHPNAAHDNGLLVVITGEYCGRFVRRLNHRHTGSVSLMTLAVITRAEDGSQTLEGEVLELGTDVLCTVTEPKEERERYKNLTQTLRNEYRIKGRV